MSESGLVTRGLTVRYGGVVANDSIDLEVRPGTVVGLIGPNGAGKTTLVDAVTGFTQAEGAIELNGRSLAAMPPHRRKAQGLTRTWQSAELFGELTVEENLLVSAREIGFRSLVRDVFGTSRGGSVDHALEAVGLMAVRDVLARDLTLGQQKLVGVARALAGRCDLLLLDEPAAGLDSNESLELGEQVRSIARSGPGILLIDHDMSLVLNVCDLVYVLEFGKMIFHGTPAQARVDAAVAAAYLGSPMEEADA
jgi:branched-chain amino acid transport system ATP-binding protein